MKEITHIDHFNMITGENPSIIEFGTPDTCIPCKMAMENLTELEESKKYDLTYYKCSDIDIITSMNYSSVPVIVMITPRKRAELTDSSVAMDIDELQEWIEQNIGE